MPTIIIRVPREGGRVEIEAKGYKGKSCLEATKWIRDQLKEPTVKNKPEMYDDEKEAEVIGRVK